MGGEPLINPEISQWIEGARSLLPNAQIRFVTNGTLLTKHWWVVDLLRRMGNCVLKISRHIDDARINDAIDKIFSSQQWHPITQYGIERWQDSTGMIFQISQPEMFLQTFRNDYANMAPHDSDPAQAFDICVQKRCPLLHQDRLYKCGTTALTPGILDRFGRPNWQQWIPYVDTGLDIDCTDQQLEFFCRNFGRPHAVCRQCPSSKDTSSLLPHRTTVRFKKPVIDA